MKVKYIRRKWLDMNKYSKLYAECEFATPFHNIAWLDMMNIYRNDLQLKFIVLSDKDEYIAVMPIFTGKNIPLSFVSLPYDCYGGFICNRSNIDKVIKELANKKIFYLLWKVNLFGDNFFPFSNIKEVIKLNTWVIDCRKGYDNVFRNYTSTLRNNIRKANSSGIIFKKIETDVELDQCYEIYKLLVQKHSIRKPYSKDFFEALYDTSLKNSDIIVLGAKYGESVIAFSVFLISNGHCFYWISSSSNQPAATNATKGIVDEMVKYCCSKGIIFNMGAVPEGNSGLIQFKAFWGAEETFYYTYESKLYRRLRG